MGSGGPDLPARVENGFGFYLEWSQFPGGKETICLRNLYGLGNSPFILALTEHSMIKKDPFPNSYGNHRTCGIFINAQTRVWRRMNFRVSASFLYEAPWLLRVNTSHPRTHWSSIFLAFIASLRLSESHMLARSWAACPHECLSFEPTSQYEKNFVGANAVSSWSSLHLGHLS